MGAVDGHVRTQRGGPDDATDATTPPSSLHGRRRTPTGHPHLTHGHGRKGPDRHSAWTERAPGIPLWTATRVGHGRARVRHIRHGH